MALDAFVFESSQPKARVVGSVRIATSEEIELLIKEIRTQGNARVFPIILKQILAEAVKTGTQIKTDQLASLAKELSQLRGTNLQIRRFKHDLNAILNTARECNRPIVF